MKVSSDAVLPGGTSARPRRNWSRRFGQVMAVVAAIALTLRVFVFAPFNIPSESMMPTLLPGDYVVVWKWPYGYSRHSLPGSPDVGGGRLFARDPVRGDVAVFRSGAMLDTDYIKRVIGLPGDRIAMRSGRLFVNGIAVPRRAVADLVVPKEPDRGCFGRLPVGGGDDDPLSCRYPRYREALPGGRMHELIDLGETPQDTVAELVVPPGKLFVLGDNRDRSADSRFEVGKDAGVGLVDRDTLVGRAAFIVFSSDSTASWSNPAGWRTAVRWQRIGQAL